jgi:hypothetical protein
MDDYFWFGFYKKKIIKLILKKKKRNRFKPTSFDLVFLDKNRFKQVGSIFSGLSSVRFFRFRTYKTEPVGFFMIRFFQLFFF